MDSEDAILAALEGRLLNVTEAHVKLVRSLVKAGKQRNEAWSAALIKEVETALVQFHNQQVTAVRGSLEELAKRAAGGKVYPQEELEAVAGADVAEQMQSSVTPSLTRTASGKGSGSQSPAPSPRPPRSPPTSNGKVAMKPGDGVSIRVPTPIFEEEDSTRQRTTPTHQRKSLESFKRGGVEQSGAAAGSARRMRDGIRERDDQVDLEAVKKVVPKSDSTRQRLGNILSQNFIFSDLEPSLREEIIDAFTDIRIAPGTEVIKQNDVGDNFYIVDVGEFEVVKQEGQGPPVVVKVKGPEESFGEIALLYDCPRNATVRALTHGLLWFVDRVTFKSIILRHLTESKPAQILREAPALHKLATRDVVNLSNQSKTEMFARGECIIKSGAIMEKVYVIAEGQVRVTNGAPPRTGSRQLAVSSTDTAAVLGRLAVLGESMLLSGEQISTFNYVAASDAVTAITIDRALFDTHILNTVRRGLQLQLVTVALQRVPALSDLKDDQLQTLAESFSEQSFACGSEVTRAGSVLGSQARIYIVQSGRISLSSLTEPSTPSASNSPSGSSPVLTRSKTSNSSGWSSKLGGIFRGDSSPKAAGGSAPGSPSGTAQGMPMTVPASTGYGTNSPSRFKTTEPAFDDSDEDEEGADESGEASEKIGALRRPLGMQPIKLSRTNTLPSPTARAPMTPQLQPTRSLQATAKMCVTTYGCFGDETLLGGSHAVCSTTAVVESGDGSVVLSISLSELTAILGPIQEILMRATNLRVLRSVPCLDYLTESEVEVLATAMGVVRFAQGENIYKAGEQADRMYVVRKGTVAEMVAPRTPSRAARASQEGRVYQKGSFFGESALIGPGVRKETIFAGGLEGRGFSDNRSPVSALKEGGGTRSGNSSPSAGTTVELYYLDRAVLEANLGPLEEVREQRRKEDELKGIVKAIKLEELNEIGLLGTGLFGKVKLVYNKRTGEHYALKCVSKTKVVRMQEEEHLRNEKLLMSELEHPFIAKLIRTFKDKENVYLLQELTTGRELFLFMEKAGRLKEWEAAFYAGGVLLALEYMHSKGIVYRDLKPENTLIDESGYPKLIDMGFAKRLAAHRKTYSMCGTPDYMAPEIIRRQGHTKAVDYWALGCMIFEMVTNTSPFNRGDDPPQTVFQRITEGRLSFPSYMTQACVDIIRKLLDPNPETRLGCGKNGAKDIKDHPFFAKEINFNLLIRMKEEAPMIPPRVQNFGDLCIDEDVRMDEMDAPMTKVVDHSYWDDIF